MMERAIRQMHARLEFVLPKFEYHGTVTIELVVKSGRIIGVNNGDHQTTR